MILTALRAILLAHAPVFDIVGDRIFPVTMPDESTFPLLVLTKASAPGSYDLQGDVGLERARVQIDSYSADGYAACEALHQAVRRKLSGFKGGAPGFPCQIDSSFVINEEDLTEPVVERGGPRLRRRMLELLIWNREI